MPPTFVTVSSSLANTDSGIEIIDWSQEERDKLRSIAQGAWKDVGAQSELAQEAYDAHVAFMKKMGLL